MPQGPRYILESSVSNLLWILNAVSVRVAYNRLYCVNMLIPTALMMSILILCWIGIHNTGGLILFTILYGFFSGGFVSLASVALTSSLHDRSRLGTRGWGPE